jgi:predicted nucleic acid-binding protein
VAEHVLVDTSVWIDHLRKRNERLAELLEAGRVWTHRFVIGELACGNLAKRTEILRALGSLAHAPLVDHEEVLKFVERERLAGRGLGFIDMHLLASAELSHSALWALDRPLAKVARTLELALLS